MNISEKILEIFIAILLIGLFAIIICPMYNRYKYCENNPNEEICNQRETTPTNNNNSGIKCGWVFGSGFKCGIGF